MKAIDGFVHPCYCGSSLAFSAAKSPLWPHRWSPHLCTSELRLPNQSAWVLQRRKMVRNGSWEYSKSNSFWAVLTSSEGGGVPISPDFQMRKTSRSSAGKALSLSVDLWPYLSTSFHTRPWHPKTVLDIQRATGVSTRKAGVGQVGSASAAPIRPCKHRTKLD
jgi:hypothetical protein